MLRQERREDGRLLDLVLDAPKGNVLDVATMSELRRALAAARDDRHLRMVLLRGAGGNFSYGASVPEHSPERAPEMLHAFHALVRDVAAFPAPVCALVEGKCLGGAFELVLAAHFVLAAPGAAFACPEIKLGVFPPVLAAAGAARLGPVFEALLLGGDPLPAERAHALGFVTELVPSGAAPLEFALAWYARVVAPLSAFSLRQACLAARRGSGLLEALGAPLDRAEKQYLSALLPSHDGNEGITAFLERRAPVWEDR